MTIRFHNFATTTLNNGGSVNNSSNPVTFVVTSAANFPTSGDFYVRIDDELLKVTSVSGTSFTAARAQSGTTIATHTDGSTVSGVIVKEVLDDLQLQANNFGVYASLPVGVRAGQSYICTDANFKMIYDGANWIPFNNDWKLDLANIGDFSSWVNQGTSTWTDFGPGKTLTPEKTAGDSARIRLSSTGLSGDFVFTTLLWPQFEYSNQSIDWGIGLRESGSGKLVTFTIIGRNSDEQVSFERFNWNSATSINSASSTHQILGYVHPIWLRIRRVTNDYFYEWSLNGYNWSRAFTHTTTDFIPSAADGIFIYVSTTGSGSVLDDVLNVLHCKVG